MSNAITIPSLQVNGKYIPLVPNSLTIRRGFGTTEVKAQSIGSVTEPVFEKNQAEAVGMISGEVFPTEDMVRLIREYQELGPTLRVDSTDPITNEEFVMVPAVLSNDPDLNLKADGTITVEFMGGTVV